MNTKQGPADFIFYFLAEIVKCENCWGGKGTSIFLYAAISAPSASVRAWLWADVEDEKGGWVGVGKIKCWQKWGKRWPLIALQHCASYTVIKNKILGN